MTIEVKSASSVCLSIRQRSSGVGDVFEDSDGSVLFAVSNSKSFRQEEEITRLDSIRYAHFWVCQYPLAVLILVITLYVLLVVIEEERIFALYEQPVVIVPDVYTTLYDIGFLFACVFGSRVPRTAGKGDIVLFCVCGVMERLIFRILLKSHEMSVHQCFLNTVDSI